MDSNDGALIEHYHRRDLLESILSALKMSGKDSDQLTCRDLRSFDEFHIRGLKATRELASAAGFQAGMRILDLGCSIGGPARALADEIGCNVVGIDIIESYCTTASELTKLVKLDGKVTFQQGDIAKLPFENDSFEGAWSLHSIMNTPELSKTLSEVYRVLKRGSIYALYEVCEGEQTPPLFPVPWASDERISYLVPPQKLKKCIESAGFEISLWEDNSAVCLEWFRERLKKISVAKSHPSPGMELLLGDDLVEKSANVVRNLEEDRIRVVIGAAVKQY